MMIEKLAELGACEPLPRGRLTRYETKEEAAVAKKESMQRSQILRRQLLKDAREKGLEPPQFKRGRPKLYTTEEEAKAAQRAQNKLCKQRYNARVLQALETLEQLVRQRRTADSDKGDSSDEEKNLS